MAGGISILFVDEEPARILSARKYLEQAGEFQVEACSSVQEALDILANRTFDLIVAVTGNPGTDGIAFLYAVRGRSPGIPFILFTSDVSEAALIAATGAGADFCLRGEDGDPGPFAELAIRIRLALERKREGSSEGEGKFRTIFEHSPYPIAISSLPDNRFIEVNRAFLEVSGFKEEEIVGKDPVELGLVPLTEALRLISYRLLRGKLEDVPLALTVKAGKRVHVLFSTIPITIDNKPALVTVTAEVTKLKQAGEDLLRKNETLNAAYGDLAAREEELRQNYDELRKKEEEIRASEEKFRVLVGHSLDGIIITDFTGNLLFANHSACRMVDVPDYAALGKKNVMDFMAPESRNDAIRNLSTASQDGDPHPVTYKLITATGREIRVECIGRKIPFADASALLVSLRDVTARTLAEERLRESENKFSTLFRSSPVALTLVSAADGIFVDVNEAFLRSTGYSRHEIIGRGAEELGLFADRAEYKRFSTALRHQRSVYGMEMKCRVRTGGIRICRFSSGVILMAGKPHILSTIDDITERRKAEEALRESEEKFHRLADHAPDLIYRMSLPDGKYEYVSPAAVAMTGYSPEEFYTNPGLIRNLIHPDWQAYFREQWQALLNGRVPPFYEYLVVDRAGKTRWFNQRNVLVTGDQNRPVAIEGIVTDITHQKEIERELRRREQRSLAVSENAGSWIWEVDPDGMYRYSSPAVEKMLGYRPDDLIGKVRFYDLFDPSVRENLRKVTLAAFARREPFQHFLNLNRHRNGTPVLLMTSGTPVFDEKGFFAGYCGIDEDVTDRTTTEAAIQAMVRSMVGTTGIDSLRKITENVSSWLGTECVMIGEIQPDRQNVKVLSMLLDGKWILDYSYTLRDTPCDDVTKKGFCLYPDNVIQLFPKSRDLIELNVRGYIGTPLWNSQGKVMGILCAMSRSPIQSPPSVRKMIDIIAVKAAAEIERSQMGRALLESEERFRGMAERSSDLILILNKEMSPSYVSPSVRSILGFDPEELVDKTPEFAMKTIFSETGPALTEAVQATMSGLTVENVELRISRKDGTPVFVNLHAVPVFRDGVLAGAQVSMRDITAGKKAELALRESEEKFRSFVENANEIVFSFSPQGIFTYVSPKITELLGYDPGELIGKNVIDLIHPDDLPACREIFLKTINVGTKMTGFEYRIRHRNGTWYWHSLSGSPVHDASGTIVTYQCISHDITERRRAEDSLRQLNKKLALLSSITRHDISNQLLTLDGFAALLHKKIRDPAYEKYFTRIKEASSKITDLIRFTKEYDQLGLNVPVWQDIEKISKMAAVDLLSESIRLSVDTENYEIYADPMLMLVLYNLFENSKRHGGTVTEISVRIVTDTETATLIIEDNGKGIPENLKEKIFERGFGNNTGLGLFLIREILEITGLSICESGTEGKGARFEITLPAGTWRKNSTEGSGTPDPGPGDDGKREPGTPAAGKTEDGSMHETMNQEMTIVPGSQKV